MLEGADNHPVVPVQPVVPGGGTLPPLPGGCVPGDDGGCVVGGGLVFLKNAK